jgi:multidrug efflux pump subunit AcrA (membrane-fusion protein)
VIDPTTMYLETNVPSVQLSAVHVGAPVSFTVAAYRDRTFKGRIERVSPAADPATRQVPVFVSIDNGDGSLVAGLFAEGRIAPASGPTLIIPGAALDRSADAPTVVRLARGHIERKPVEIGRQDRDGAVVEIRSGLTLGDTVLLGVARSLPTGTAARVADTKVASTPIAR